MKTVYADFNTFSEDGVLALHANSIAAVKEGLVDGEMVWFSDGEIRAKGRVHRREDGSWEGRSSDWQFTDEVG